jgi:AraC-like DNA-binding protein
MVGGDVRFMRSKVIPILVRELGRRGHDAGPLLARWDLQLAPEQTELWVSLQTVRDVTAACAALARDESFGFHVGLGLERGAYGVVEFAARCVPTIREALARMVRFATLVSELVQFELEPVKGGLVVHHAVPGAADAFGRQVNEFFIGLVLHLAAELVGRPVTPLWVAVAHDACDTAELSRALGCPVRTGAGRNSVAFRAADLDAPVVTADPALLLVLERFAATEARARPSHLGLLPQVRTVMRALLPAEPAIDAVAAKLKMSRRTLQRRLGDEGVTFQQVLDSLRRELALQALAEKKRTTGEIAWSLGYSDARAFTRALKRWSAPPRGA